MQLKLHADRQPVAQDPLGQLLPIHALELGREVNGVSLQSTSPELGSGPLVVRAIRDHELELVTGRVEVVQVRPVVRPFFPARRTLEVDDLHHGLGHSRDGNAAARLAEYHVASLQKSLGQLADVVLEQRLSARQLDQPTGAAESVDLVHDLINRQIASSEEGVLRIAPGAAQVAARSADEDARLTRVARLALNRVEDLGDTHAATEPARRPGRAAPAGSRSTVDAGSRAWSYP